MAFFALSNTVCIKERIYSYHFILNSGIQKIMINYHNLLYLLSLVSILYYYTIPLFMP